MTPPKGPVRWLHRLGLRRPRPEDATEWEIEHHLAEATDRLVAQGWPEDGARAEAERRFGDPKRYGMRMRRDEEGRMRMEWCVGAWQVLRQAALSVARSARREPGFTLGVVLTLGLGLGANATMFGIVDRLLLRPPEHIVEPDAVTRVFIQRPSQFSGGFFTGSVMAYPDYVDLRAHSGFSAVAGYSPTQHTLGSGPSATRVQGVLASSDLFPLLGVEPSLGRFFSEAESRPGADLTAVIGHGYWQNAYGSDPAALGRTLEVDGRVHTIVGVAPPGFTGMGLRKIDVWTPLEATHVAQRGDDSCMPRRGCYWMTVAARLDRAVSLEAAEAEATVLHRNGRRETIDGGRYSDRARVVLGPIVAADGPEASDESRVATWLAGVSGIVLLIACANVANLLLARTTRKRRELDVRLALGAGRARLFGQYVTEAMLLALAGGALALAIAHWGGAFLRSTLLPGVYFPGSGMSGRLVGFTVLAAGLAGLLAGVAPWAQSGRRDLTRGLQDGGRNAGRGSGVRALLTVAQGAMAVVLLVGAGLFMRSLGELRSVDLGIDVDRLAQVRLELTTELEREERLMLFEEGARRISALPAVTSAAASSVAFGSAYATSLRVPGLDSVPRLPGGGPYRYVVSPGYFETVGLGVLRGRPIDASDVADGSRSVVVSELMARTLWPESAAVGRCLQTYEDDACSSVVGVVEDAARGGFQDEPFMAYYLPMTQAELPPTSIYVRTSGHVLDVVGGLRAAATAASPTVRYANVQTLREMLDPQARSWTLGATMFTVFGLLALVVAAIGLYSVLAFDVAQRTRELGIRTALGAEKARLLRSVLYRGTRFGLLGIALGLGVAYWAAPYARDLLFEVSPRDPGVLGGVAVTLVAVSLVASIVPGLRATRVDPLTALKSE